MMTSQTNDFDFDRQVTEAHLAAAGWGVNDFIQSNPFDAHAIYACDYRTGDVSLFSVKMSDFEEHAADHSPATQDASDLATLVAGLLERYHQNNSLTQQEQAALLPSLVDYIKSTRTYQEWRREEEAGQRLHFVVNVYPGDLEGGGMLRPFILCQDTTVIDVDMLLDAADQICSFDLEHCPTWFADNQPLTPLRDSEPE